VSNIEYTEPKQKLLIDVLLSSEEVFSRCQNILSDKYFVNKFRPAVRFILKYADEYRALPKVEQVIAETNIEFKIIDGITSNHVSSFLDEIEEFCKNRALANAVLGATELIEKGNYGEVEKRVKEAILISLQSDLGTNYFADPKARLERIKTKNGQISTGWKALDDKLYGGVNRGEITIYAGGSGSGKSLVLQNLSLNFVQQGYNVVYLTLELSEELTSMRIDSMLTGITTRDIFHKLDELELKLVQAAKKSGTLYVKQIPQGSRTNDIKVYLKNYEIETGRKPDVLVVDYLDLVFPNNKRIDTSDLFITGKFVTEELRGLGVEMNMHISTASQLNRSAVNEQEHDHSMISGGISKIQTADNVLSIFASAAMKERGEYQLQFLKTRSSSGVGSKITLGFDPNTLRIFNLDDNGEPFVQQTASDVFDNLRRKNSASKEQPSKPVTPPVKAAVTESGARDLSSLKSLINRR